MSGAVGSKPALTRRGRPSRALRMMRSRRSSSRMISARPFLRYVSCSSGVEATKPIVAIDLTPLRLVAVDEIARAKVPFRAKFGEYEGVPCHQVQLRPANSQRLRDEHVF